eukprot:12785372-Alexandrium_andersonii.AAC.1
MLVERSPACTYLLRGVCISTPTPMPNVESFEELIKLCRPLNLKPEKMEEMEAALAKMKATQGPPTAIAACVQRLCRGLRHAVSNTRHLIAPRLARRCCRRSRRWARARARTDP